MELFILCLSPPSLRQAWILRRGSLYQKHHSWMRHRPLRKISCHPFLKIFVNLVSSVCGFISTCINVSSLVTEPEYLGEDIIKNVWGVGGRRGCLLQSESVRKDRAEWCLGGGRWSLPLVSWFPPGSPWNTKPVITDKRARLCLSSSRALPHFLASHRSACHRIS